MDIIFQGIGTEIIGIVINTIISATLGGIVGYRIGISKKQKQKAGKESNQIQNSINIGGNVTSKDKIEIGSVVNDKED